MLALLLWTFVRPHGLARMNQHLPDVEKNRSNQKRSSTFSGGRATTARFPVTTIGR